MSVRGALVAGSSLLAAVRDGKQALRATERGKVIEAQGARVLDSIDLDSATRGADPRGSRWDYLLGTLRGGDRPILGMEIHPATSGQAKVVIAKKRAALSVIRREFIPGKAVSYWYWVASGTTAITRSSREARLLASAGIRLAGGVLRLSAR